MCVRKERDFYVKMSNQVAASGRFRHDLMRERTSLLFGVNQMLVSASGGEGSSPLKNQVKIGFLRKLTCERAFQNGNVSFACKLN